MSEGSIYDWWQRRPWILDVPFAGLLALVFWVGMHGHGVVPQLASLLVLGLAVRRRHPVAAFTAVTVALAIRSWYSDQLEVGDVSFLVALYSLSAYERRPGPRWAGLGVGALGSVVAAVMTGAFGAGIGAAVGVVVMCFTSALSAWLLGGLKRARLGRIETLQERAAHLERERDQQVRIAGQAERAAIAREMHDVVAHALSVIVVQADGASYAAERRPEGALPNAVAALTTIAATARDALGDTRRLVGVLRDPESGMELAPVAGLDHVDDLVARVRSAGVPVSLSVTGVADGDPLPVALDLAAYRVVQESLTNVIKHGGPGATAAVRITRDTDALRVWVSDTGRGGAAGDDGRGHGLPGMRERVAVHQGLLTAGPGPRGGWQVRASLPL